MHAPQWFIGVDSSLQIIEAGIALAISYYSLKGYRLVKDSTLFFLHFAFVLLGVGLLTDGVVSIPALAFRGLVSMSTMGYIIRVLAEIMAYTLLLFAYLRQTRRLMSGVSLVAAIPGTISFFQIMEYHPLIEIIVFFLVAFIATQAAMNYSVRRERNSLLVFIGFVLLALGHVFYILLPVLRFFFVMAHLAHLIGFLLLLTMLLRVTRTK